ncbi:hypothetical protein HYH02_010540 [Chlamydomonas schloesseri]|uniref:Cx9C motif-containing protein 4, mitochondrial n=1 Tax=Chlamydomonas schloesseri TaxID=2026947 RepID=A0A835TK06_9CHLO|nr:hypothetical protein HYH02_010540 [Chlamydomonas schloesseri]|eukprot:KAG2439911.1 hypothetical protein HYH02_010540 [Chlamydomonas schloesseri]
MAPTHGGLEAGGRQQRAASSADGTTAGASQPPPQPPPQPPGEPYNPTARMRCDVQQPDPKFGCKLAACAIQSCLAARDYDQRKCAKEIQALVQCCQYLPEPSVHCKGFGL